MSPDSALEPGQPPVPAPPSRRRTAIVFAALAALLVVGIGVLVMRSQASKPAAKQSVHVKGTSVSTAPTTTTTTFVIPPAPPADTTQLSTYKNIGGAISPIDLASATASLGVSINIVEGGIRKVTEGSAPRSKDSQRRSRQSPIRPPV